jgi:hypothetical protein
MGATAGNKTLEIDYPPCVWECLLQNYPGAGQEAQLHPLEWCSNREGPGEVFMVQRRDAKDEGNTSNCLLAFNYTKKPSGSSRGKHASFRQKG